jgi:MFS family permease
MAEVRTCFRCSFETSDAVEKCPRCGGRLKTAQQVRRLGWVQVVLGVIIVGMMGTITAFVAPLMLSTGDEPTTGSRYAGTPEQALLILGLFGIVILFGLVAMLNGIWQIKYGRRNKWLFIVVLVLAGLLVLVGWVVRSALRT